MRSKKWGLVLLSVTVLLALALAGCGGKESQPKQESAGKPEQAASQQPEAPKEFKYASSDMMTGGCNSCHQGDFSLTNEIQKLNKEKNHPLVPAESVQVCQACHAQGTPIALPAVAHKAHLVGADNKFATNFDGNCVYCHTMASSGKMVVNGMVPEGVELVAVKSANADTAPEGCTSCHQKYAEDKDYSLMAETKAMNEKNGHPVVPAQDAKQCVTCHQADGAIPFNTVVHKAHLTGQDNKFVSNYGGSCRQCHSVGEKGEITTKGL